MLHSVILVFFQAQTLFTGFYFIPSFLWSISINQLESSINFETAVKMFLRGNVNNMGRCRIFRWIKVSCGFWKLFDPYLFNKFGLFPLQSTEIMRHNISDVTSTSFFISDVINKLRLRAWTSRTTGYISFLLWKVWLALSATSSAEIDNTLQHHSGLKGNERSWSDWPWLESAVTHLLIVCSSHFPPVLGCDAGAPASLLTELPKKITPPTCAPCA